MQQHRPDFVQNDGGAGSVGIGRSHRKQLHNSDSILIGIPLKDDNNHEPTVQARQHHGRGGGGGNNQGNGLSLLGGGTAAGRHHGGGPGGARMTPLEIGMYVLLAAFCFAIVVFVVSCVVYASKFKPQVPAPYFPGSPLDSPPESSIPMMLPGGGIPMTSAAHHAALMANGNQMGVASLHQPPQQRYFGGGGSGRQMQEPTTNAHDWVWLGRTTLERTSGMLVPAANHNLNHAPQANSNQSHRNIRITANPGAEFNYNVSPSHHQMAAAVDSATYCKEKPGGRLGHKDATENLWKILPPPPPLPPHGARLDVNDPDYRPPVPPHRNIGVTAKLNNNNSGRPQPHCDSNARSGRRHHHHHHHHHRNNSGGGGGGGGGKRAAHNALRTHHDANHNHHLGDVTSSQPSAACDPDFQFTTPDSSKQHVAADVVKRATIVGNPMFSMQQHVEAHVDEDEAEERQHVAAMQQRGASKEELLALEDLNLGMDYQQIMEYFDNLKESNA
ncbi:hypothetical protein LSTR_LSTR003636 [Laodelphax striatellus]|uniref:Transmembrane protein TMEM132 C-terminal domain-containing protein n=1 Tax=Laodelphax striatellus TaxID=195883 RepID=A0A482XBM4_LAOST|nr:hypothetical protein LSTR_LSTR003636 [Laodelphax striatellus]